MFKHGLTGVTYQSVREKIKYYRLRAYNDPTLTTAQKNFALRRLKNLERLNHSDFNDPELVITDDKLFGNGISKPRLCVAITVDKKDKVLLAPIHSRTSKTLILDKNVQRQISNRLIRWVNRDNIYDLSAIKGVKPLTKYDKDKIRVIFYEKK